MTLFSLRLLQHPVTRDFFAETVETSLPPFPTESMTGLEVTFELEGMIEKEKLLFLPLGVVSGLFIGSVLGEPHSLMNGMRQSHRSLHPPSCRRFALDLEKQELMEVSWYLDRQVLLVNWVHFPTDSHCLSYFVVYEAPPPGKLPHKLYKSVEMISRFDPVSDNDCYLLPSRSLEGKKRSRVCSVPEVRLFFQRIMAPKSGVVRTTEYLPAENSMPIDRLARFRSHSRLLQDSEMNCFLSLNKTHPVSQLPLIETDNALEGIRQLLYSQQRMDSNRNKSNHGESSLWNPTSTTSTSKDSYCKKCETRNKEFVDSKQVFLDCEFCKQSSLQEGHTPTWIDAWNSMSTEEHFATCNNNNNNSKAYPPQ
jgi:hypothetical protein